MQRNIAEIISGCYGRVGVSPFLLYCIVSFKQESGVAKM